MEATPKAATKHFSMIRAFHLADVFTLANAACGVAATPCCRAGVTSCDFGARWHANDEMPAKATHRTTPKRIRTLHC